MAVSCAVAAETANVSYLKTLMDGEQVYRSVCIICPATGAVGPRRVDLAQTGN